MELEREQELELERELEMIFRTVIQDLYVQAEIYEDEYTPENKKFTDVTILAVSEEGIYSERELEKMVRKEYEKEKMEWK